VEGGVNQLVSLWKGPIPAPVVFTRRIKFTHGKIPGKEAERIVAEVAERHGLTAADLKGPSRLKHISHPRQEAMAALYITGRYSLPGIGRFLGGRDHTTVLVGIRKHEARMLAELNEGAA
jgi:chromosomal replication initiation ATPase DnaA